MSLESYSDDKSHTLSVDIPGTSSVDSSLAPSPSGILSSSASTTASTSSLPSNASVTFAPLPELAPRKRRSTAPLGMAARSQLVGRRRRRDYPSAGAAYQGGNPMWTEEEIEQQREIAMQEGRRRHYQHHYVDEDEGEMDDPFVAFGRMVKVAGKSIWRKVSHKDLARTQKEGGKGVQEGEGKKGIDGGEGDENRTGADVLALTSGEQRHVLATIGQNGEDVSDSKDSDEEHFRTIGQTETIREGHTKYTWITEGTDEPSGDIPTEPAHLSP
ncbi:hypothetical protein FPV67DRAFT_1462469 [Lyophyllum atratum]|nr:hypothetical protein FPV67DRAFT_1462469 [Lyophyllum atratum]